jgi:hypothetical protein
VIPLPPFKPTGIVPILSILKKHVEALMKFKPDAHLAELKKNIEHVRQIESAEEITKGTIFKKTAAACCRRDVLQGSSRSKDEDMRNEASRATRSIYGVVLLAAFPVLGVSLIALTISWNTIPIKLYWGMTEALQLVSLFFQVSFALIAFCVWEANNFFAFTDVAICLIAPFADWYWVSEGYNADDGILSPTDITLFSLLVGYMTARFWAMTVRPRYSSWRLRSSNNYSLILECLEIIWVTRSASLVSEVMPDIDTIWRDLAHSWGEEHVNEVCRISVYVTDKDPMHVTSLQHDIQSTRLYQAGCVHFGRPNFQGVVESHTLEMICTRRNSYTLLAFCGSPQLASELHQVKIYNDMMIQVTGNEKHQMEFVSESYGGHKKDSSDQGFTAREWSDRSCCESQEVQIRETPPPALHEKVDTSRTSEQDDRTDSRFEI